jgi:hypothetical protein
MKFGENTYTAQDIRKLKTEISAFPMRTSIAKIAKALSEPWKQTERTLKRWIIIAMAYTDETIDLFEAGKINRLRLSRIAEGEYPNPSYKDFIARQAIEKNLSYQEIDQIRKLLQAGRLPVEAIGIVRGERPEKPITRNDALSIDRLVKEWEKDGFAWRQRATLIKKFGKLQVIQAGKLSDRIAYTLAAMTTIAEDMSRYIDEMWKEVPQEVRDAVEAEFRGEPQTHSDEPRDPVKEVTVELPVIAQAEPDEEPQAGPVLEAEPSPEPVVEVEPGPMSGT